MKDFIPSLEHLIYQFLQRPDYRPLKQHELIRALNVPANARRELRRVLADMERRGKIVCLKKNRWSLPDTRRTLTGTLSAHAQGFGFVASDTPGIPDIFIPQRRMGAALHGDRVRVEITADERRRPRRGRRAPPDGRPVEGRIVGVVERRTNRLAGLFKKSRYYAYVIPDNPRIKQNVRLADTARGLHEPPDGYKVVVELNEWSNAGEPITGTLTEVLGPADDPGVQMAGLIRGYGLDESFPDKVEHAAKRQRVDVGADANRRRDLRDWCTLTIDPVDARDYDDAVSLRKLSNGHWELGVHIADVSHYVKPGSDIDREAYQRGNSVYLVDRVITMLPPHLTERVCSLVPDEDRLTHTVRLVLDSRGKVLEQETFPSIIHSRARLDYDRVQRVIKGHDDLPADLRDSLRDMHHLAQTLRKQRRRAGAILFTMPEVYCALDETGRVTEIRKRVSYEAYQLIEEFMLLANRTVARLLAEKQAPALYRIHEPPDPEQWERMAIELQEMGIVLDEPTSAAMNEIAAEASGTPKEHAVNLMMLRNLKRAIYSAERKEHFGLAFSHYLHFTSPIRRYPDLVVHRALKALEEGAPPPYTPHEIAQVAAHCTRTERNADDAEQESVNVKRVEYYREKLEAGETGPYPAVISSIVSRGFVVELTDTQQRGLLSFASIRHDHVRPHPRRRNTATGSRRSWSIGDPLVVELVTVDTARGLVDFRLAGTQDTSSRPVRARKMRRARR